MTARDVLRVNSRLSIPLDELEWRFGTSGGPGGQHANRAATRAEVSFDAGSSPWLGPRQRARIIDRLGPVVRAASGDERSQARNRDLALERLAAKLAGALAETRPRVATAPTRRARRRRVDTKRHRGIVKRLRARPETED